MNILIMSDIHGNEEALKSVCEYLKTIRICKMIILGDVIDYGPHSNEVIEIIQKLPYEEICNIRGNHESAIIKNDYYRFSSSRGKECAQFTRANLNRNSLEYITEHMSENSQEEFEVNGKKCLAVHGSLDDSRWGTISLESPSNEMYSQYDYVFSGHSHIPHIFSFFYDDENPRLRNKKRTMFINPGSIGQPRNHNPRSQFAVWNTDTDEIRLMCIPYDIEKERNDFSNKIDCFYKDRLIEGV